MDEGGDAEEHLDEEVGEDGGVEVPDAVLTIPPDHRTKPTKGFNAVLP